MCESPRFLQERNFRLNPLQQSHTPQVTHPFSDFIDIATERLGGKALLASDDFFAAKENMLKAKEAIFIPDKYTTNGKWMDGWESRRKRTPGHDWCIVQLGMMGKLKGVNVNTAFFVGNNPESFSLEAARLSKKPTKESLLKNKIEWKEIISKSTLKGGSDNFYDIESNEPWTHLRLNIFPDGGVARFRVYGEVTPDWEKLKKSKTSIDLVGIANGGKVVTCNDMFFGSKDNLIFPERALVMGDGWETRRKRVSGYDWIVVRMGHTGKIEKIEIDTNHFKGNFPESCTLEGLSHPKRDLTPSDIQERISLNWQEILPRTKLKAHFRHFYTKELSKIIKNTSFDYIRMNIFPDGGISRLRVFGKATLISRFYYLSLTNLPNVKQKRAYFFVVVQMNGLIRYSNSGPMPPSAV